MVVLLLNTPTYIHPLSTEQNNGGTFTNIRDHTIKCESNDEHLRTIERDTVKYVRDGGVQPEHISICNFPHNIILPVG